MQSQIPTGKRESSACKCPDLWATGKRQPGSSFSDALCDQHFNSFALRSSTQISNILKTPKVFSVFLWVFCYLSFCLKRFGRSVRNTLCCIIQKPQGNGSMKKITDTLRKFSPQQLNDDPFLPFIKRNAGIKITSMLGKPLYMCMSPLYTQHIISR